MTEYFICIKHKSILGNLLLRSKSRSDKSSASLIKRGLGG